MLASRAELLERLPLFKGLSPVQLDAIAGVSRKAFFDVGEHIIAKDEPGRTAYVIMTGTARCLHFLGAPPSMGQIGPGMLVGELAMIVDTIHTLTVQAKDRVRALAIHRDALTSVMELDPEIAQQIAENLLARLQAFSRDLRKVDYFLAQAGTAPGEHQITPPPKAVANILSLLWPFPERKTRRARS
jgi:CRP/FNR family transcriptional regulator, cyclic AMP receptor protein